MKSKDGDKGVSEMQGRPREFVVDGRACRLAQRPSAGSLSVWVCAAEWCRTRQDEGSMRVYPTGKGEPGFSKSVLLRGAGHVTAKAASGSVHLWRPWWLLLLNA